jgi:hypothetical protein
MSHLDESRLAGTAITDYRSTKYDCTEFEFTICVNVA